MDINLEKINSIKDLLKSAFADFKRNKIRTFLTSLGILIGVFSVVMLIALGLGLKNYIYQQFESMGANLLAVMPGGGFGEGGTGNFGASFIGGVEFDDKDVSSLKRISELEYVAPVFLQGTQVEALGQKEIGYIMGSNEELFELLSLDPLAGNLFTKGDVSSKNKVAVLGYTIAEKLFGDPKDSIGKTVRTNNQRFKVIGVLEKKGDNQQDSGVFIPYKTIAGNINKNKTFYTIYLGVESKDLVSDAKQKAIDTLSKRYDEDKFSVIEQAKILSTINQIFSIINAVLVSIGSISLLVGGIGIMNIMYASVTERTKEVGIRRAVGATRNDILIQFLTESVILSLIGGLMGLLISIILVLIIRTFFPASINLLSVFVALAVSTTIGIFFGVLPAKRAANLAPIEAIRYE